MIFIFILFNTLDKSVSDLQNHRHYKSGTADTLTAVQACCAFESQSGRIPKSRNFYHALFLRIECTHWRVLTTNGVPTRQPFLADVHYVTLNEQRYCHPVVCHPNYIHITYPSLTLKKGEGVFIFVQVLQEVISFTGHVITLHHY